MSWQVIVEWAQQPQTTVGLLVAVAALAVWNLVQALRWGAFIRRWKQLMQHSEGGSLEHTLYETLRRVSLMEETLKAHGNHLEQLQSQTNRCCSGSGWYATTPSPTSAGSRASRWQC